jgi:hypothetical protein
MKIDWNELEPLKKELDEKLKFSKIKHADP